MIRRSFRNYNREELNEKINSIDITRQSNQVITKYFGRVIKVSNVSDIYEVFDINSYLSSKLDQIESNFSISKYDLTVKGGIQSLTLISDPVDINGNEFYKSFFILNSTDRSRKLSFDLGLFSKSKSFFTIHSSNIGLSKRHLRGVTKAAEESTQNINVETFDQQINDISSLVNHKVKLSNIRDIIVDENLKVNHSKFDSFKWSILNFQSEGRIQLSNDQKMMLRMPSEKLQITGENDFYIDAFFAFQTYLRIFSNQDSHLIKKETEKIMKITQCSIRNNQLELLGI
jgi:hypothetical protein